MQFLKHDGRDTRVPRKASYKSSSCVEDRLKRRSYQNQVLVYVNGDYLELFEEGSGVLIIRQWT